MQWLPEGHLAYFVLDLVRELDVSPIDNAIQSKDGRGVRPYSPRMMTALLLYAYCVGVFSSRKVERATYEDVAFRVLAAGEHPHFTTVNAFRLEHREALAGLFVQVLKLCARAGLDTVGHVSLDGSKVQANASKHKAMSYARIRRKSSAWQPRSRRFSFVPTRPTSETMSSTDQESALKTYPRSFSGAMRACVASAKPRQRSRRKPPEPGRPPSARPLPGSLGSVAPARAAPPRPCRRRCTS